MTVAIVDCEAFGVQLFMAGDIAVAKQVCREFCFAKGWCVTVTPTTFIYTGGEEEGFVVGAINYARFPTDAEILEAKMRELADTLMERCCQHSYSLVGRRSTWVSRRNA